MDTGDSICIEDAIQIFTSVMCSLSATDKNAFLSYIADNWKPEEIKSQPFIEESTLKSFPKKYSLDEERVNVMKMIAYDIKKRLPFDGTFPSEEILPPTIGEVCYFV